MFHMATNARQAGAFTACIAGEIRGLRAKRGVTQAKLASASGIARSTLTKIESGDYAIDVEQLGKIANALGVDPFSIIAAAEVELASNPSIDGD